MDGNVLRVYARLMEDDTPIDQPAQRKKVSQALAGIYPERAGDFTQALIELGATVCGPNRRPDCESCPCKAFCGGGLHGTAEQFPVKSEKKSRRVEEKTVFILSCDGLYALEKRPEAGLLAGLWQFPNCPGTLDIPQIMSKVEGFGLIPREIYRQVERKHIFTHITWQLRGVYLEVQAPGGSFHWRSREQIEAETAIPTAFRQFWEEIRDV